MKITDPRLERLQRASLLVIGDLILDDFLWGTVERISPEAPVPVVSVQKHTWTPGGAANVAANAASLGARAHLIGVLGEDGAAGRFRQVLRERSLDDSRLVVEPSRVTTTKSRLIAHSQQVVRFDVEQRVPISDVSESAILERMDGLDINACVLSDYAKGVLTPRLTAEIVRRMAARKIPVLVDPKARSFEKYRGATVLTPNAAEARAALNGSGDLPEDITEVGVRLAGHYPESAILITCGAQGMILCRHGAPPLRSPAVARNVYDVTGAGDTAIAALACVLAAGGSLEEAAMLANRAAGIVVGKVGTATVAPHELLEEAAGGQHA